MVIVPNCAALSRLQRAINKVTRPVPLVDATIQNWPDRMCSERASQEIHSSWLCLPRGAANQLVRGGGRERLSITSLPDAITGHGNRWPFASTLWYERIIKLIPRPHSLSTESQGSSSVSEWMSESGIPWVVNPFPWLFFLGAHMPINLRLHFLG